ncbi:MAG: NAD-dependent epimerase/dehydratase family protein [Candidatus Hydrogenedentes bacterium]|nr:NAD-dependent epimerase/dehydratase family protein [Candidatus Hydrogenedentota bacterium]
MKSDASRLCLVTGGAGFIGSHTVDALLARGYSVRILDCLQSRVHPKGKPSYLPAEVDFMLGDVSNPDDLDRALQGVRYVYHLAAYQDYLPDFSTFFHVNTESTALLYELIVGKHYPVEKVVVASSQAVYGEGHYNCRSCGTVYPDIRSEAQLQTGQWEPPCPGCGGSIKWTPTAETAVNPRNQYAISKYAQEMIAIALGKRYGIPTVGMRYSIVQGPRQSFYNAYSGACRIFCLSMYFDQSPVVYEDGQQMRDYVNIHDVVAANLLVLEDPKADYEVFNVGGGRGYTVVEFAETVARVFGKQIAPKIPGVYRFGDTRHIVSDVAKLRALGWKPQRTPEDSVGEYVNWLKAQDNVEDILDYVNRHMKQLNVIREVKG